MSGAPTSRRKVMPPPDDPGAYRQMGRWAGVDGFLRRVGGCRWIICGVSAVGVQTGIGSCRRGWAAGANAIGA